jgi:DNA-binding CsgD family transcriptional regulator
MPNTPSIVVLHPSPSDEDAVVALLKPQGAPRLGLVPTRPRTDNSLEGLRQRVEAADAEATDELQLALLWERLRSGDCHVVYTAFSESRCYVVLAPSRATRFLPVRSKRLAILESVLCSTGQKTVAIDLALAPSTVALNARLGLESLGVRTKASRVHPLLMLAAKAARDHDTSLTGRLSSISTEHGPLSIVSIQSPDRLLRGRLPPAELSVIANLLQGATYREIACLRGTSTRTIANQITAVFRRLRVSGRNELVHQLFERKRRAS